MTQTIETSFIADGGVTKPASDSRKVLVWLGRRHAGPVVAALAFLMTLPALGFGLMTDDLAFPAKFERGDGAFEVFRMTTAEVAVSREQGMFPWWTSPNFRLHFMRPLAALSHQLDFQLWADAPWVMHLINSGLYAWVVLLAAYLYRALLPAQPQVAGLAALMFAIDDGHATATGWISNRSLLLTSVFVLSSVLLYVKTRARPSGWLRIAGVGCFALALSTAESGLVAFAFLIAYALTFETGSLLRRFVPLLPELAVCAIWAVVYVSGDYGAHGMGLYRELSSPLSLIGQGLMDLPAWLFMLLGPSLVDIALLQAPIGARVAAVLLCVPLLVALYAALPRTREVRFFALVTLGSLPPLFSTLPQDRLLVLASFGAFGVLASFLVAALQRQPPPRWMRATRGVLIALHLVLAPLLFVPALGQNQLIDRASSVLADAVPVTPPRQIVLVNTPIELLNLYAWQRLLGDPTRERPETFAQLYSGNSALTVRRVDERTLELRPEHGWGHVPLERMFTNLPDMPRAGSRFTVSGMEVLVDESTPDGRPKRVSFRFPTPLEDPQRLFLVWEGKRPVPWRPPAVGLETTLAPLGLLNLMQT